MDRSARLVTVVVATAAALAVAVVAGLVAAFATLGTGGEELFAIPSERATGEVLDVDDEVDGTWLDVAVVVEGRDEVLTIWHEHGPVPEVGDAVEVAYAADDVEWSSVQAPPGEAEAEGVGGDVAAGVAASSGPGAAGWTALGALVVAALVASGGTPWALLGRRREPAQLPPVPSPYGWMPPLVPAGAGPWSVPAQQPPASPWPAPPQQPGA